MDKKQEKKAKVKMHEEAVVNPGSPYFPVFCI